MLRNEDLVLRSVSSGDLHVLFRAINDPELVRYSAPFVQIHEGAHQKWFEGILNDRSKSLFVIDFGGQVVGTAQLVDLHPIHRSAEVTIRLFFEKDFNKGIGSRSLRMLCDHGFRDLNLNRIWLRVFESNARAVKAYEKSGFKPEGVMREAAYVDGGFVDVLVMARLRNDEVQ